MNAVSFARTATTAAYLSAGTVTNGSSAINGTTNGMATNGTATKCAMAAINGNQYNLAQTLNNGASSVASIATVAGTTSKKPELAAKIVQQSNIVCFDVDSTVIREEGIDELATYCGKGSEVARVTQEAMGGSMTFQDALKIRLNIIRPSQQQIRNFIAEKPSILTRNVRRFIEQLKANGKQVYLISGGFDCLIEPIANELGIPLSRLYANKLLFDYNGNYAAFDTTQPTSRSGGKAEAIAIIRRQYPDAVITMIGDGATDLEAVPPADHFIGFGGNVMRAEVFKRAQYYVTDFEQLIAPQATN